MSILWMAPICALLVAATGGLDLLESYTVTYMTGFVGFTRNWFPAFMLGAIFGKIMEVSGGAKAIAVWLTQVIGKDKAILSCFVGCAVLAYGGISVFVIAFCMYPLTLALYREADISRKLIPGNLAWGMFTIGMTSLPGTPQIQNLIPMQYFATDAMAGPILGLIASIIMGVGGYIFMRRREKYYRDKGEHFTEPTGEIFGGDAEDRDLPNPLMALLPLIVVVVVLNVLKQHVVVSLVCGVVVGLITNIGRLKGQIMKTLNDGAANSVQSIINTSAAVGFGSVVSAVPGFADLTNAILNIQVTPLLTVAIAITLLAGATGSASGGMGIALEALGPKFVELSQSSGISLQAFHRVASVASGGLDSLPHNGAIITVLSICGMTHKDSYFEMAITTVVIPVAATLAIVAIGSMGIL